MRQVSFRRRYAPAASMVLLGFWLGPVGWALGQETNRQEWACYPPHPKWGWLGESPDGVSAPQTQQDATGAVAQPTQSDPISAAHPDWNSIPTEETWLTQTEPTESAESFEPAAHEGAGSAPEGLGTDQPPSQTQQPLSENNEQISETAQQASETEPMEEEPSVCLSENGEIAPGQQPTNSADLAEDQGPGLEGEVQSIEEYFRRYGAGAGEAAENLQTPQDHPSDTTEGLKPGPGDYSEQMETSLEQPERTPQQGATPPQPTETPTEQPENATEPTDSTPEQTKESTPEQTEPSESGLTPPEEANTEQINTSAESGQQPEASQGEETPQDMEQRSGRKAGETSDRQSTTDPAEEAAGLPEDHTSEIPMEAETPEANPTEANPTDADTTAADAMEAEQPSDGQSAENADTADAQSGQDEQNGDQEEESWEDEENREATEELESPQQSDASQQPGENPEPGEQTLPETQGEISSPELSPTWEYQPGYGRVEAEYAPPAESGPAESVQPSNSTGQMPADAQPDVPKEKFSEGQTDSLTQPAPEQPASEGLPEQEPGMLPPDFLPQDRYEYPEQQGQEGGQNEAHLGPEASSASDAGEPYPTKIPSWDEPVGGQSESSGPADSVGNPSASDQAEPTDTSWADMPGPVADPSEQQPQTSQAQPEEPQPGKYQWWLENADRWTEADTPEETSQPVGRPDTEKNPAQQPEGSANRQASEESPMGEEGSAAEKAAQPSDSPHNSQNSPSGNEGASGAGSPTSAPEAGQDARSGQPGLLKAFGQSVLRLFEPWRKTFSGIVNISTPPDWLTGIFSPSEAAGQQDGTAARPAEALAR